MKKNTGIFIVVLLCAVLLATPVFAIEVYFSFFAPEAEAVYFASNFNYWDRTADLMVRNEDGLWEIYFDLEPGHYQYKFVADGEWYADPYSEGYTADGYGGKNSVIIVEEEVKPEKLTAWVPDQGETVVFERMAADFTERTGIEVEFVVIGVLAQRQKLALDGPAGKGPDVFTTPHDLIGQMSIMGLIEPIRANPRVLDEYTASSLQALSFEGRLYGLPWATESTALYYNRDIFPEIPDTFEELVSLAKEATADGQYGLLFDVSDFYFSHAFFTGKGGYVFAPYEDGGVNPNEIGLGTPGSIAGMEFLKDLSTSGLIPQGTNTGIAESLFMEGKVGAIISGPWYLADCRKLRSEGKLDFGIVPLPPFADGGRPSPFSGVKGFYVSSYSDYPQAALELIKAFTSKQAGLLLYEQLSHIPTRYDVMQMDEFLTDEDAYNFALQSEFATPMPNVPEMLPVWGNMADAINLVINEGIDPQTTLELAVEMIEESIMEMQK